MLDGKCFKTFTLSRQATSEIKLKIQERKISHLKNLTAKILKNCIPTKRCIIKMYCNIFVPFFYVTIFFYLSHIYTFTHRFESVPKIVSYFIILTRCYETKKRRRKMTISVATFIARLLRERRSC